MGFLLPGMGARTTSNTDIAVVRFGYGVVFTSNLVPAMLSSVLAFANLATTPKQ
jgi:hypothetical protein